MEVTKTLTEEQVDMVFRRIGKAKEGEVIFNMFIKIQTNIDLPL